MTHVAVGLVAVGVAAGLVAVGVAAGLVAVGVVVGDVVDLGAEAVGDAVVLADYVDCQRNFWNCSVG